MFSSLNVKLKINEDSPAAGPGRRFLYRLLARPEMSNVRVRLQSQHHSLQ